MTEEKHLNLFAGEKYGRDQENFLQSHGTRPISRCRSPDVDLPSVDPVFCTTTHRAPYILIRT